MTRLLLVRVAGAFAVTSLALFLVGLIPFFDALNVGAGPVVNTSGVTVNRAFKGDRLPIVSPANSAVSRNEVDSQKRSRAKDKIPVGCEPAFSLVTNPRLASYYGRCAT